MKIKKYVADSMPEVLKLVKNDLGPKAVVLNTRSVDRSGLLGKKGQIEVTAAVDARPVVHKVKPKAGARPKKTTAEAQKRPPKTTTKTSASNPAKPRPAAELGPPSENVTSELSRLSAQIRALQSSLKPAAGGLNDALLPETLSLLGRQMQEDGLDSKIAHGALRHLLAAPEGGFDNETALRTRVAIQIAEQMPDPIPSRVNDNVRTVAAFIGPSGAGKTTAVAKLAAQFGESGAKVCLITTDTDRIGGLEQIRAYAGILDLPVDVAYTPDEMHDVIQNRKDVNVILIDTGGISPIDHVQMRPLSDTLREAGPSEVHLVLGASTGLGQMRDALESFSPIGIDRLLFTRLDETARFGAACTMAVESSVPMSYITNSRTVPGDIHPARAQILTTALLHRSLNGALKRA